MAHFEDPYWLISVGLYPYLYQIFKVSYFTSGQQWELTFWRLSPSILYQVDQAQQLWSFRRSLDMHHWTKDLWGRWSRVGDLENADLHPGIKMSGRQKLLTQLVLPTTCTRGCFETSNTYLPDKAKTIGLRIINMCVNFLVFQCYFFVLFLWENTEYLFWRSCHECLCDLVILQNS